MKRSLGTLNHDLDEFVMATLKFGESVIPGAGYRDIVPIVLIVCRY